MNTYVDDPILAVVAPKKQRDLIYAMTLVLWSALGLPLSLNKAVRGEKVTWTSAIFEPIRRGDRITGIRVQVKVSIVEDVMQLTAAFLKLNLVKRKELRSYVGKLMHIASLVYTMRPFLQELYAALKTQLQSNAPQGSVWTKQILPALYVGFGTF